MQNSKKVAILSPALDPYKFIDECILLPWLFEQEPPDILFALCSRLPFRKQYSGKFRDILSNPNVINQMVDDDDNLVSNRDKDSLCALFTTDEVDELIEFRNEYCETQQWKKSQNDIWQLFYSLTTTKKLKELLEKKFPLEINLKSLKSGWKPKDMKAHLNKFFDYAEWVLFNDIMQQYPPFHSLISRKMLRQLLQRKLPSKTTLKNLKNPRTPRGIKAHFNKFLGDIQGTSSLIKDYKAVMQIQDYLYSKIDELQKHPDGRAKLINYFGDWEKTPSRRKNMLLTKLIAYIERSREWMNPGGYAGLVGDEPHKCRYRETCPIKTCRTHPKYQHSYFRYEQSFREIPYILAKLGVFTRLKCEYKEPYDRCSAVGCLSKRINECAILADYKKDVYGRCDNTDVDNFCDFCLSKTKDTCPLRNPCPKGQEKYKNERKKITTLPAFQ